MPDASWLERYCKDVPESAHRLAERFWPGPLTMILPRKPIVPLRTTGGLDTVGVRCPNHPVTLAIIRAADVPIAAPSGNTSGRPSPTCLADMLEDMDGKIDGVFDGGPVRSASSPRSSTSRSRRRACSVQADCRSRRWRKCSARSRWTNVVSKLADGERPKRPGMKYRHYAPKAPVTVVTGDRRRAPPISAPMSGGRRRHLLLRVLRAVPGLRRPRPRPGDKSEQARRVFDALREFDHEPSRPFGRSARTRQDWDLPWATG